MSSSEHLTHGYTIPSSIHLVSSRSAADGKLHMTRSSRYINLRYLDRMLSDSPHRAVLTWKTRFITSHRREFHL